eukprot:14062314-Alexandrium_andersonii.AAC.1
MESDVLHLPPLPLAGAAQLEIRVKPKGMFGRKEGVTEYGEVQMTDCDTETYERTSCEEVANAMICMSPSMGCNLRGKPNGSWRKDQNSEYGE